MNAKNIKKHLNAKISDWKTSIDNDDVIKAIDRSVIVTGGAIVSLLTGEEPHNYDVYFKDIDSLTCVCLYYVEKYNKENNTNYSLVNNDGRLSVYIKSDGITEENNAEPEDVTTGKSKDKKQKYRPIMMTSNAITLSDKIQIVLRFYGDVEEIHKNYDFAHCTCAWSSWDNNLSLPSKALECIINKELYYIGSKYPLCSIIRTRKFLSRGYTINAGQYVKMAMQLNEFDLTDISVLEDQLTGVDTGYFEMMIDALQEQKDKNDEFSFDSTYVAELVDKLF